MIWNARFWLARHQWQKILVHKKYEWLLSLLLPIILTMFFKFFLKKYIKIIYLFFKIYFFILTHQNNKNINFKQKFSKVLENIISTMKTNIHYKQSN